MNFTDIIKKRLQDLKKVRWNIGFVQFTSDSFLQKDNLEIRWMKHNYKNRWFADPFILNITTSEIILLVEEFYDPINRGRIAKLIIDKDSLELKEIIPVLELDSHLSFPVIYRYRDEIFIYPENSGTGKLILYKYNELDSSVSQYSVLSEEPFTDATINTFFGRPFLFTTMRPTHDGNVLSIYSSDKWDGDYKHFDNIKFKDNTARNAGDVFQLGDKLIRPAQDCNGDYGKGLVMQEVKFINNKFIFKELKRFYPASKEWDLGLHSFNVYNHLAVVDAKQYRTKNLAKLVIFLKKMIN